LKTNTALDRGMAIVPTRREALIAVRDRAAKCRKCTIDQTTSNIVARKNIVFSVDAA